MITIPSEGFKEFQLYREAYGGEFVELKLPNGSTYHFDEIMLLRQWMSRLGIPEVMVDKALDMVWNFRRINYDLTGQRATVVI